MMRKSILILFVLVSIHGYRQPMKTNATIADAIKNLPVANSPSHKVMVLGSPHFDLSSNNSDWKSKKEIDMLSTGKQQEIEQVVQLLKQFKPTRICIEWEPKLDSAFNARYQNYLAGKWSLTRGEYYQLGFRLAKEMGHTKVYCIDNKPEQAKSLLEIEDWDNYVSSQSSISEQERKAIDALNEKYNLYLDSIKYLLPLKEYLVFINSDEVKKENKRLFLTGLVHVGNKSTYAGADLTGSWYQRNTRIFSNVKKLCTSPEERILIIYGNMHAFVLEELFRGSQQFEVVPVSNYLNTDLFKVTNGEKKLAPFERKYIQYIETKEGYIRFNSILTRTCKPVGANWLIVQAYQAGNYINIDSSICEQSTLLPVAYNTHIPSDGYREKVSFTGSGIINTVLYKDSTASSTLPNNSRYNGVMTDDIVSCMPLGKGTSFTINVVNPGVRFAEYSTTVTVEGTEDISIDGLGKIPCWKVRNGKGSSTTIEWYSVKGHIQVKKKFEMGNGGIFYRVLLAG